MTWSGPLRRCLMVVVPLVVVAAAMIVVVNPPRQLDSSMRQIGAKERREADNVGESRSDRAGASLRHADEVKGLLDGLSAYQAAFVEPSLEVIRVLERKAIEKNDITLKTQVDRERLRLAQAAAGLPRFSQEEVR